MFTTMMRACIFLLIARAATASLWADGITKQCTDRAIEECTTECTVKNGAGESVAERASRSISRAHKTPPLALWPLDVLDRGEFWRLRWCERPNVAVAPSLVRLEEGLRWLP